MPRGSRLLEDALKVAFDRAFAKTECPGRCWNSAYLGDGEKNRRLAAVSPYKSEATPSSVSMPTDRPRTKSAPPPCKKGARE